MQLNHTLNSRKGQVAQHWRGALPVHDASDLFPTLTEPELLGLGEDIRRNGQQVEIALFVDENGVERLLDGRNRLDAMEGIGIPVIKDGELNRDAVRAFNVPGNADPYKYVLSVNILRRHLTNEQKNELAEELIKRNPNQSNRTIAKLVKRDDKTVGTIRKKMESRAEIPHVETRTDTKGRKQPARKPSTKTAGPQAPKPVAKKPEVQEPKQEPHSIAATLDYHFNALSGFVRRRFEVVRAECRPQGAPRQGAEETADRLVGACRTRQTRAASRSSSEGARVMSALLAAALDYAAKRLPVFPCVANGKEPAIARGFHAATTNPETIKPLLAQADRNIGIPTGSVSGFWVLDVDGDNGEANLFALEAEHGRLPATREVITGGGGRHLWFKYTGPIQSTTSRIAPGVDTRGDGGYVIVPPSIHASGRDLCTGPSIRRTSWPTHPSGWCNWRARSQRSGRSRRFPSRRSRASGRAARDHPTPTAHAALEREIETLAGAPAGTRNNAPQPRSVPAIPTRRRRRARSGSRHRSPDRVRAIAIGLIEDRWPAFRHGDHPQRHGAPA